MRVLSAAHRLLQPDDYSSAEENLADLRNDIKIIVTVASQKKRTLPAG